MTGLKPCPFCGKEDPFFSYGECGCPEIDCFGCGMYIGADGPNAKEKLIENWNRGFKR